MALNEYQRMAMRTSLDYFFWGLRWADGAIVKI